MRSVPDAARFIEHMTEDGRRVFVAKTVLEDLAALERIEHPVETACLLFGGFFSDGRNTCAIVTKLIFPEPGEVDGTEATVTITAEGAEAMIARAWQQDPLLKPLGWGHTHPLFEAYFSHVDREEQSVWTEPASVGIVISGLEDPRERYMVFVGPASDPATPLLPGRRRPPMVQVEKPPVERRRHDLPRRRRATVIVWPPLATAVAIAIAVLWVVFALAWMTTGGGW